MREPHQVSLEQYQKDPLSVFPARFRPATATYGPRPPQQTELGQSLPLRIIWGGQVHALLFECFDEPPPSARGEDSLWHVSLRCPSCTPWLCPAQQELPCFFSLPGCAGAQTRALWWGTKPPTPVPAAVWLGSTGAQHLQEPCGVSCKDRTGLGQEGALGHCKPTVRGRTELLPQSFPAEMGSQNSLGWKGPQRPSNSN